MIDTAAALLAEVIANPADDAPRLIYADWLEEHGDSARAEFIRVQCDLAELLPCLAFQASSSEEIKDMAELLRRRERELLSEYRHVWVGGLPVMTTHWMVGDFTPDATGNARVDFRRGFVAAVTLTAADWLKHAAAILRSQPVERVTLTDVPTRRQMVDEYAKMDWHEGMQRVGRQTPTECLRDIWHWIDFTLPPAEQPQTGESAVVFGYE